MSHVDMKKTQRQTQELRGGGTGVSLQVHMVRVGTAGSAVDANVTFAMCSAIGAGPKLRVS